LGSFEFIEQQVTTVFNENEWNVQRMARPYYHVLVFALRWKSIFSQKPTNRPPKFNWDNSRPYTPTITF
jgi:hypothetical protein